MTENSVADERLTQVEMLQRRLAEVARRAKEHPEQLPEINTGLQYVVDGRPLSILAVHPSGSDDPLAGYRKIKNLIFVGHDQWNKATTSKDRRNRNPLGLSAGWCPQPVLAYSVDQMKEVARFCAVDKNWQTRVIYYLALPNAGGIPTSLNGQHKLWAVPHDNLGSGLVRNDIFWSNWHVQPNYDWANILPVNEPIGAVGYEHPFWTASKNWADQQKAASDRNMTIVNVAMDALMLNLARIDGKRLRESTYSRTCTVYDGFPLSVHSYGVGVNVFRRWDPEDAFGLVAASVQGVPLELGF